MIQVSTEKTKNISPITDDISPLDLQYEIKKRGLSQRDIAEKFGKSDAAISCAINNDPLLASLRKRIIKLLNSRKKKWN